MNKTTEALKLAEEALEKVKKLFRSMTADECPDDPYISVGEALAAIREVLAEPEITTPDVCGEVCARAKLCYGCGKALDEANARHEPLCEDEGCPHHGTLHICVSDSSVLADHSGGANEMVAEPAIPEWVDVDDYEEPPEQEPVAWVAEGKERVGFGREEIRKFVVFDQTLPVGTAFYTTPPSVEAAVKAMRDAAVAFAAQYAQAAEDAYEQSGSRFDDGEANAARGIEQAIAALPIPGEDK